MLNLTVACQPERPNVEAADLTALVIRALGLILGKLLRDEGGMGGMGGAGGTTNKRYFILTKINTAAAQALVDTQDLDIN